MLTAVQINAAITATGAAETGAAIRGVGEEARTAGGKVGIFRGFLGSFLGQQLIFGLISKAIAEISTQIRDIGTQTNAWDASVAQMNAVLTSTHQVAGLTAKGMLDLAQALSTTTDYNNTAVLSTENLVATFTGVSAKTFPETTKAVLDMATALKEDTKSAAIQLGKALQDPILGVTALRRVGVNFTKDQTEMLKKWAETGQTAKAQAFILAEIEREFGGSAAAATTTFAGKLQLLSNQFDVVKENIGNAVIPILTSLFGRIAPLVSQLATQLPNALTAVGDFFNRYLRQPFLDLKQIAGDIFGAIGQLIGGFLSVVGPANDMGSASGQAHDALKAIDDLIRTTLTPAMKPLGEAIGTVVTALLGLTKWATDNKPVLIGIAAVVGIMLADAFLSLAVAAGTAAVGVIAATWPFILVGAAIALLVAGIVILVQHWGQVTKFLGDFAGAVGDFIGNVLGAVGDFGGHVIEALTWPFRTAWDHIGPAVKGILSFLGNFFGNLIGIGLRFDGLMLGIFTFPFRFAWAFIGPLLGFIMGKLGDFFGMVLGAIGQVGGAILGFVGGAIGGLLGAFGWVKDRLGDLAGFLGNFIGGAFKKFGDAWNGLGTLISNIWPGIQGVLKGGLNVIIGVLNGFIDFIDKMQIHIPAISVGPVKTPGFDWNGLGIPEIPKLAKGGTVGYGTFIAGEAGAEQVTIGPGGAMVQPLTTQHLGETKKSMGGDTHIHIHSPNSQLTGYEVARIFRKQAALTRGQVR